MIRPLPVGIVRNMRELAGGIVPRSILVSCPIHPSTVYRTGHMLSAVLLLRIQERRNAQKCRRDKNHPVRLGFHLIPLSGWLL